MIFNQAIIKAVKLLYHIFEGAKIWTHDAILHRRSTENIPGEVISDELATKLVTAGAYAPTARDLRTNRFLVIRDKEKLAGITDIMTHGKMIPQAGCVILVFGDKNKEPDDYFVNQNASAAIENILLAAHGMGLGAVWCGVKGETADKISKFTACPSHFQPMGLIAVGYPAEEKPLPERYDPEHVFFETFQ